MLKIVQHVENGLGILLLHLLGDVGGEEEAGPRLRHPCELSRLIVKAHMDDMRELGGVGDVGLLVLLGLLVLALGLAAAGLLRLLGQGPHVHGKAHLEVPAVGGEPQRRRRRFLLVRQHDKTMKLTAFFLNCHSGLIYNWICHTGLSIGLSWETRIVTQSDRWRDLGRRGVLSLLHFSCPFFLV